MPVYKAFQEALRSGSSDSVPLQFGDANDVKLQWDGSNLEFLPVADDTGVLAIGDGTTDMDTKWYGGTTTKYVLFDVGNVLLTLEDVDLKLGDNDEAQFGDASGGDVSIMWNATNLLILPAVDDTGAIYFGDGTTDMDVRVTLGAAADYLEFDVGAKALELVGDARIDLSGATLAAANTDGGVIKGGTSSARIVEDTADMKFVSIYTDCGATSGDSRLAYIRHYITGAGGAGESLRAFTTIEGVAAAGGVHGAHLSLNFAQVGGAGAFGSASGLGVAVRGTLHVPNATLGAGTYAAMQPEIWSDGASSESSGVTELSFLRCVNGGNATGIGNVDDDGYLVVYTGGAIASGNIVASSTTETNYSHSARCKLNGTVVYMMFASAEG